MNIVLYYGGFFLAIVSFLMAAVSFFVFRIPQVAQYLRGTRRKGLVKAAKVDEKQQKEATRKSDVFEDDGSSTMPLDILADDTDAIQMQTTAGLTGRMRTLTTPPKSAQAVTGQGGATEVFSETTLLDG